ncbi:MAG: TonB-dependent receptor [Bacteroidota bacterium]
MKAKIIFFTIVMFGICNYSFTQTLTQTIKGRVIDKQSQSTIPGANISVIGSNPIIGVSTDIDGYFKLEKIPVGRISLLVTFMGYASKTISNLNLTTGKELILNIELEEDVVKMTEVVVKSDKNKGDVSNKMSTVSARTFSVEESQRFAGARNDVSRMATNYAGVNTANDAVNDIVIRGNSPNGLLWRMEGVDIPNPNHFGGMGGSGGPVSMLNNNVLANSDFMTSAFPAEYADAFSGVFDLKMRSGNYEKHEFLGQVGFNGFELGAEGPICKRNRSSYLINYRYSTLGLLSKMGMNFGTGTAIPEYQDLTFKFNFPTKKVGIFTLFGLGGTNSISFMNSLKDSTENAKNLYASDGTDIINKNKVGVVGFSHLYIVNPKSYTKFILAATGINNNTELDSVISFKNTAPYIRLNNSNVNYSATFFYNLKVNSKHNLKAGITAKQISFNLVDSIYLVSIDKFKTILDNSGSTNLYQPYIEWQFRITGKLTFNGGFDCQYLAINNSSSIEPRAGLQYEIKSGHTFKLGYGLHSKMHALNNYFSQVRLSDGSYITPNKELDFIKSNHFVLGYDWNISSTLRLKAETYYQDIFQSVVDSKKSSYSLLNSSSFNNASPDTLVNGGSGRNYGFELTFEKFMDKGFYGLITTSLFKSEYKGSDDILRSTAFDGKYVVNALAGKEFIIGGVKENSKRKKVLSVDLRCTSAGGQRYTSVDIVKSEIEGKTVYDNANAFNKKFKDYFRADIRAAIRIEGAKASQEFGVDIQNVTNQKNPLYLKYNKNTGAEEVVYQLGLYPMVQYRIDF